MYVYLNGMQYKLHVTASYGPIQSQSAVIITQTDNSMLPLYVLLCYKERAHLEIYDFIRQRLCKDRGDAYT